MKDSIVIFDIKRYALHDGPGIRTTVFLKGCPLRCVWCHNPESWSPRPELLFRQKRCISCNTCGLFPNQLGRSMDELLPCFSTDELTMKANACPAMALEMAGRVLTVEEIVAEVEKERDVMQDSGGGVTLCGGEPLMQAGSGGNAVIGLLDELGRRGFHRCVDTSLYAIPKVVQVVAARVELFLVDLKLMDSGKHKHYTGVSNERILQNIRLLDNLDVPFIIRIPLVEGVNADEENIEASARFLTSLNHPPIVELLPYHDVGRDKHRRRGTTYNPDGLPMDVPSEETQARCVSQLTARGLQARFL